MRYISLILFLVLTTAAVQAQTYSYVYIQGDKQMPFYVKLEGEMLPRYGKNYCIIPRLEAGIINIDILFQQNAYPVQHFVIKVPEHGARGFYLTQKNGAFSLYDLQQQFYLPAGNTAADDHAPEKPVAMASENTATPETPMVRTPPVKRTTPTKNKTVKTKTVVTPAVTPPVKETAVPGQPNFIGDIELNNDHSAKPARPDSIARAIESEATRKADSVLNAMKQEKESTAAQETVPAPASEDTSTGTAAIVNSDCPAPLSDDQFEAIYKKALQQSEEEDRLSYLDGQLDNCYTTAQAGILAKSMDSDAARFTFLKKVFPRITDQSKFVTLKELLSAEQWRGHFTEIVNHPSE